VVSKIGAIKEETEENKETTRIPPKKIPSYSVLKKVPSGDKLPFPKSSYNVKFAEKKIAMVKVPEKTMHSNAFKQSSLSKRFLTK
jgi:hypothetical protein